MSCGSSLKFSCVTVNQACTQQKINFLDFPPSSYPFPLEPWLPSFPHASPIPSIAKFMQLRQRGRIKISLFSNFYEPLLLLSQSHNHNFPDFHHHHHHPHFSIVLVVVFIGDSADEAVTQLTVLLSTSMLALMKNEKKSRARALKSSEIGYWSAEIAVHHHRRASSHKASHRRAVVAAV